MKNSNLFMLSSTKYRISALIFILVMNTNIRYAYSQEWNIVNPSNPPPSVFGHTLEILPDGRVICYEGVEDIYNDLFAYDNGEWNALVPTTTPPPPRKHCGSWSGNGKLYINGGEKNTRPYCLNDTWNYDTATGEWSQISTTNTPAARYGHKANEHPGGYVLISGGTNEMGIILNEIFKFDMVTNQFTLLSNALTAISGHVSEIVNNRLYILSENNLVQIYDITNNTWSSNQQGPPIKHSATSAVGVNDFGQKIIFVFGGFGNNGLVSNTVYEYNTVTNTTTLRPTPIPQSIAKGASATIASSLKSYAYLKVIYFGGINGLNQIVHTTMEFTLGSPSGLPGVAGTITGTTTECQGQNAVTYTVPSIANSTAYIWTLPTGATGTSTTNSITVNYGASAASGSITVKGSNGCGNGATSTLAITVNALPAAAGTITGTATVCQGQNAVTYTVPSIANATSYIWTLPTGATGTSTTNSITVNYGASAASGSITVKGTNTCGNGAISTLAITVNALPAAAETITGTTTVCQGQNAVTYSVPSIVNATSYIWTLPTGATGTSTTNSITVNYSASAASGNISVLGTSTCGNGATSTLAITVNPLPATAVIITGTETVCLGQNAVTYTVPSIVNSTAYIWTLPTGAIGTSTTNSISVNYGTFATSGNISVKGTNTCGNGAISTLAITVNALPVAAGTITGTATVCQGQNSVIYTVPSITNAATYIWTLPSGATGSSTTNSITVNYGTSATSGSITVKGSNTCGNGAISTLAITVNALPVAAGTITGTATVCQGQIAVNYSVPAIANAISYIWTLPTGAAGTSLTNSISVNYASSAVSGNIAVKGHNDCGDGTTSTFAVNVNPIPVTPVISQNGKVLQSNALSGNQWYNQDIAISGATSQNYTIISIGDYTVKVTLNGCSSLTSNMIKDVTTHIVTPGLNETIKIYPNPVSDDLTIEYKDNQNEIRFEIFNSGGQLITSGLFRESILIPTSLFSAGIYIIKFNTGKSFEFRKVIKHN